MASRNCEIECCNETTIFGQTRFKLLHVAFATTVSVALVTGFWTFNWDWQTRLPLRELLFLVHRAFGILAAVLGIAWVVTRLPGLFASNRSLAVKRWIKWIHVAIVVFVISLSGAAWLGRAQDGRWMELVSFVPVYNFVSRPDTPLAHYLLYAHAKASPWLLVLVVGHAVMGIFHLIGDKRDKG